MSFNRDSFSVQHKGRTLSLRINSVLKHKEETLILLLAVWYICDYQSSFPWECPKNAWLWISSNVTFYLIASFSPVWQMCTAWPSSKCTGTLGGTWIAVNAVIYFLGCCRERDWSAKTPTHYLGLCFEEFRVFIWMTATIWKLQYHFTFNSFSSIFYSTF